MLIYNQYSQSQFLIILIFKLYKKKKKPSNFISNIYSKKHFVMKILKFTFQVEAFVVWKWFFEPQLKCTVIHSRNW